MLSLPLPKNRVEFQKSRGEYSRRKKKKKKKKEEEKEKEKEKTRRSTQRFLREQKGLSDNFWFGQAVRGQLISSISTSAASLWLPRIAPSAQNFRRAARKEGSTLKTGN